MQNAKKIYRLENKKKLSQNNFFIHIALLFLSTQKRALIV